MRTANETSKQSIETYIMDQAQALLSIDSPSGYTREAADHVMKELMELGYEPVMTIKGGVLVCLGKGSQSDVKEGALLLGAHLDTLGGMVKEITPEGRLKLSPIGGLNPNNAEAENCRIITREKKIYTGTFQLENASLHVNNKYNEKKRAFPDMEVLIDEIVTNAAEVKALGIGIGDIVAFEPRTIVTESGYIKSRFLDDKLCVAIMLGYAKRLKEMKAELKRTVYLYITVFEEVGHGSAAAIPTDVTEVISVDMGCVGDGLECDETMVSICAKDSSGPYHYEVVSALIDAAKESGVPYAVDVYPYYSSDADAALASGHEIRHGLIGPGVYASHGYERSHVKGVNATAELLYHYTAKD
ncbi:MAG: M42 family metallopeptidase [Lachnospiraceae bacterium]